VEAICSSAQIPSLAKAARRVFEAFKVRRLAALDTAVRAAASFDDQPALAIAAVDLAAERKKLGNAAAKLNVGEICAATNVSKELYKATRDEMLTVCFPQWAAELKAKSDTSAEKKREKAARPKADPEKKRKFDAEFSDWKELQLNKNPTSDSSSSANKKQTTLSFRPRCEADDAAAVEDEDEPAFDGLMLQNDHFDDEAGSD
jgi:hypothetical protein